MNSVRLFFRLGMSALDTAGLWLGLLSLRLLLAWEFGEAGFEKLNGSNWFADIQDQFPWPFKLISADLNWALATGCEIVGAMALVIGLGTRFFSASLIVLTVVAIASVHWPESWSTWAELSQGYALTDKGHGNFKLPLIYIAMLLPLVFIGPGRLALDHLFKTRAVNATIPSN